MKRIIIFCVITFCITYALEFGLVYPLVETANQEGADALSATIATLALSSVMLIPALGVVLTRLITKEGFKNTLIKPVEFKRSFKYYLLGWFGPVILIVIGAAVYYLVFSADFDSSMPLLLAATEGQEAGSDSLFSIQALILMQFLVGILIAPLLNILTCFGEEWGWRGYLLPKVNERLSFIPTVLLTGFIWGLWHAPLTAIGHNYGLDYVGFPYLGILAMCCFCIVFGTFLSYITVKSKSCLPAAIAHGAMNGFAGGAIVFSVTGGNPFIGPYPVGVVGGIAFIAVAVIICIRMRKAPLWTNPVPAAMPAPVYSEQ